MVFSCNFKLIFSGFVNIDYFETHQLKPKTNNIVIGRQTSMSAVLPLLHSSSSNKHFYCQKLVGKFLENAMICAKFLTVKGNGH